MSGTLQPVLAGVVGAATGFFGSVAVLLAGLAAAGATPPQVASGVLIVCLVQGAVSIVLSAWTRIPIAFAWSTPGAALLISVKASHLDFSAAVGAFLVSGFLIAIAGLVPAVARAIGRIPPALSGALLAGVLLPFCLAPVSALARDPLPAAAVILVWLALQRLAPRWAAPAAILLAIGLTLASGQGTVTPRWPALELVPPSLGIAGAIGVGVPLAVVTMAGQNLPGFAVLQANDYRPPVRSVLLASGLGSMLAAPFGGHAVNLAAITGAIMAGPEASADPSRRWIAGVSNGVVYLVLGSAAGLLVGLMGGSAPLLIEAGAGLALLAPFLTGLLRMVEVPETRTAAVLTFVTVASGVAFLGIGSAFWALLVGLVALLVLRPQRNVA